MPLFARLGHYTSKALDSLVFSFPSPTPAANATEDGGFSATMLRFLGLEQDNALSGQENGAAIDIEPGEMNAIAGGVGPFSFLTGGYGVILILMAIVLNRIHHLVHRPRRPLRPGAFLRRPRSLFARALTSPHALTVCRAPSVLLLLRSWALLTIVTLQVADLYPKSSSVYVVRRLGAWAANKEMEAVCWQTFLSVCAGLVFSGLGNGLDRGPRRDPGAGFNLFGYSFLLHLYSSPLTHHRQRAAFGAAPGRPDVHALLQLWLSLTELTALQTMELSPKLKRMQMIPTAFCGIFGLSHFVYVLRYAPLKFPSFTFLTHLMALFLGTIIIITASLKTITHLFTLGTVPQPYLENVLPGHAIPGLNEDFGVALLKLGTACIEATQLSGLRNELAPIEEQSGPYVDLDAAQSSVHGTSGGGFRTEITDIKTPEDNSAEPDRPRIREVKIFWRTFGRLLSDLVLAGIERTPGGPEALKWIIGVAAGRWYYGPRGWRVWRRVTWTAPPELLARRAAAEQQLEGVFKRRQAYIDAAPSSATSTAVAVRQRPYVQDVIYRRFLDGEVADDDEDEAVEWQPYESDTDVDLDSDDEYDQEATPMASGEMELYADLVADARPQPAVLLAHLTSTSASPLTRRRYAALLAPPTRGGYADAVVARRETALASGYNRDEWDDDRRRCCVVCTIEPRDTILWPCRCLALCNDCRENLAGRLSQDNHMCPCCRRKVEGFSRIYIP